MQIFSWMRANRRVGHCVSLCDELPSAGGKYAVAESHLRRVGLEVTPVPDRCDLFGSNAVQANGFCRTMVRGTGVANAHTGSTGAGAGGGVMVRRPSVTSTDSGAKSSAYAAVSAALAITHNRLPGLGVPHCASDGALVGSAHPAVLSAKRDITATASWPLTGQVGTGVPRLGANGDMPVIDQQSGRWYVKDIRASTQPMGTR